MKIAIDVRTVTPVRSGVGNYVLHLLKGLRKVAPDQEYYLIGREENLEVINGGDRSRANMYLTGISHENHPVGDLWEHFWLPNILKANQVDVMHGPATLTPLRNGGFGSVVTIHDLVAFLFPETIPRKYALYMRWLIKQVVKRADRIISVSENTKYDIVTVLDVDPDKITVVHEAAQPLFRRVEDRASLDEVRKRYGLDGPFFYHVGNIEPRKNLVRLIEAYLLLRERNRKVPKLVISGQEGWLTKQLYDAFGRLDFRDDVRFTGYVPHQDLPLLMNQALAFVFPSLYEGFGLPVLEAMQCGTPVITSNISSLPEIVGQAAVLVDPHSPESIAQGMQLVLDDEDLQARLSSDGVKQAALFSWEAAASQTLGVYQRVYRERH